MKTPRNFSLLFCICLTIFFACKKDDSGNLVSVVTNFSLGGDSSQILRIPTQDQRLLETSITSSIESISWDLGDGRQLTGNNINVSYPKSGTYKLKLSFKSANGKISTVEKTIIVLDRVLKQIVINRAYWNTTDSSKIWMQWPKSDSADLYVKIQKLTGNDEYVGSSVPSAPSIYTSDIISNAHKSGTESFTLNVSPEVIIDMETFSKHQYIITLMAKDTDREHILFNTLYSGAGTRLYQNFSQNKFSITATFFSSIDLLCTFE